MNDFKPGLEGIVAVETEIAEPDREGGVLRYRGIDIAELVGHYPYENVWGLLVDDDLNSVMPAPEPYEPAKLTGNAPADLQAETARLAGYWELGKLNEISAEPRAAKAIDTYWICTAEHGLNASTFTARVAASTGADCGAALSAAVGALSGPLHGGAPAYVKPMLEEVSAMGDPERWVRETLDSGKRIMGFGHRVYRAEDPRSRILKETARELGSPQIEIAERLEEAALAELERRKPDRPLKTNVEYYSALVLDVAGIPPRLAPAMFACSRVAGWSAHILEQKRTGRLFRPSARYIGPAPRSLQSVSS
jgi:citrate synthase